MKIRKKKPSPVVRKRTAKTKIPMTIRRILVPIDFSEHSKNALQYAAAFGKQFNAELVLIYVVEPTVYPADFSFGQVALPNIENELRERGTIELAELVKTIVGDALSAKTLVRTGKPFLEIIKEAVEEDVDLIIIATHGHTGVEHILFGSTAEKVVRKAPCPVLIVRPETMGENDGSEEKA